jgi:hypothetical protein
MYPGFGWSVDEDCNQKMKKTENAKRILMAVGGPRAGVVDWTLAAAVPRDRQRRDLD